MPAGGSVRMPPVYPNVAPKGCDNSRVNSGNDSATMTSMVTLPKHDLLPIIPSEGNFLFEMIIYMFGLAMMGSQYINLYRTVWWLPHSYTNYTLNFYLIEPYLLAFLATLMNRRLITCFLQEVIVCNSCGSFCYWTICCFRVLTSSLVTFVLSYTGYHVLIQYSPLSTILLCYPIVTYLLLFGLSTDPLFSQRHAWPCPVSQSDWLMARRCDANSVTLGQYLSDGAIEVGSLVHRCTQVPHLVREEVELLKNDFNNRVKQVLFNSMLSPYYMAFIPVCFAPSILHYETWWVIQHVCLTWLSTFLMLTSHFFGPDYLDLLHRTALHLGQWRQVDGSPTHVMHSLWTELQVWPHGVMVKHLSGFYKADGVAVTAEPGNRTHVRFHVSSCHITNDFDVSSCHMTNDFDVSHPFLMVPLVNNAALLQGTICSALNSTITNVFYLSTEPPFLFYICALLTLKFLFHHPLHVMSWILGISLVLLCYQFYRIIRCVHWNHIIGLALMLFCNFHTLFKLFRDYLIMRKTYRDTDAKHR